MALTRKMLKAMGIEDEKIDQIIEEHVESIDGLKAERDRYKAGAEEAEVHQVFTADELLAAQEVLRRMPVGDMVVEAILDLVRACRPSDARSCS